MNDPRLWLIVGAVLGGLLGFANEHRQPAAIILCPILGGAGCWGYAVAARALSRRIGEPAAWAVLGPVGLGIVGAVLVAPIAAPEHVAPAATLGLIFGSICGAVVGPLVGAIALQRSYAEGTYVGRSSRAVLAGLTLIAVVGGGALGVYLLVSRWR